MTQISARTAERISVPFCWTRMKRYSPSVSVSLSTILAATIAAFDNTLVVGRSALLRGGCCYDSPRLAECQAYSLTDPQPDDPFDDLYLTQTAARRERRKRIPVTSATVQNEESQDTATHHSTTTTMSGNVAVTLTARLSLA